VVTFIVEAPALFNRVGGPDENGLAWVRLKVKRVQAKRTVIYFAGLLGILASGSPTPAGAGFEWVQRILLDLGRTC